MQIYLHQNNQQEGPFTLPRISARLVSGELDSSTLAWHDGMDTWYPLNHEKWQALGIVAPPPKTNQPVQKNVTEEQKSNQESESMAEEQSIEVSVDESVEELPVETVEAEPESESAVEPSGSAFASYSEEDFKPPSFEEMEKDMVELRKKRAGFPEAIGRRAYEIEFREDEIADAWVSLEKSIDSDKEETHSKAFATLGQAILSAGLNDPGLDELREEERDVADRMLNLQMQLRRMGGVKQVKGPAPWKKWVVLGVTLLVFGGIIIGLVLMG